MHAGTIAIRSGIPHDEDPWGWNCGFYPGSRPGEHTTGSVPTFEDARAEFEAAWQVFLSKRTEAETAPVTRPEAIRAMIETVLHILSKDPGEKPAKKAKTKA